MFCTANGWSKFLPKSVLFLGFVLMALKKRFSLASESVDWHTARQTRWYSLSANNESGYNFAKGIAPADLCKKPMNELGPATQLSHFMIAIILFFNELKFKSRN